MQLYEIENLIIKKKKKKTWIDPPHKGICAFYLYILRKPTYKCYNSF